MEKEYLEFLIESDENILSAEICELIDKDGKEKFGLIMLIGDNENMGHEICLSEGDLKKVLLAINNYKK
jgi:hypothetical protein